MMQYREYILYSKEYTHQYCIDFNPDVRSWGAPAGRQAQVDKLISDAAENFGTVSIGNRIFFKTPQERSRFKTWMTLKWQGTALV